MQTVHPSTNHRPRAATASNVDARVGALIAERYRIERLIGRGGMASVYEAVDTVLPRRVALKIFRPELADDDDLRRHDGEVGMLAALNHPGLVTLYDAVADERGAAVLVLELVDGTDLRRTMDARTLSHRDIGLIGSIVADALAYSHEKGIIHRDVKPANILVPSAASHSASPAKLADFGIARLVDETRVTAIGSIIGTAQYLSPEQALGGEVGPPTDVYSLGLVLIEALGGGRPFPGTGVESVAARLASDPELPDGLSAEWTELLRGMTQREPDARLLAADAGLALRKCVETTSNEAGSLPAGAPPVDVDGEVLAPTAVMPAFTVPGGTAITEVPGGRPNRANEATVAMPPPPAAGFPRPTTVPDSPATSRTEVFSSALRGAPPPRSTLRRNVFIAALVGVLIVAGGGIAFGIAFSAVTAPPAPASDAPDYPVVDGPVGDHLEQLQRSVAP